VPLFIIITKLTFGLWYLMTNNGLGGIYSPTL
jgi:hypothetical protein